MRHRSQIGGEWQKCYGTAGMVLTLHASVNRTAIYGTSYLSIPVFFHPKTNEECKRGLKLIISN